MRESPSVELMELLRDKGAELSYSDPFFPDFPAMRKHSFELSSIELSADSLSLFDVVILATDHDAFDYELIHAQSKLIIDTRGKFRPNSSIIRA